MNLKKACLPWLAAYAVMAVAIGLIVHRRLPLANAALPAAIFGGLAAWLGLGFFAGIRQKLAERSMISRARSGDAPRDGERIAAIGRISPNGSALVSPLSGRACVAYKYEVRSGGKNDHCHYEGFALTPSSIQTQAGSIRLLAYPELKVAPLVVPNAEAIPKFDEYLRTTEFREPSIANIKAAWADMIALFNDDDGSIRTDQRTTSNTVDLSRVRFVEWLLQPGDQICAIGHYSAQRGGLIPDRQNPLQQVTIRKGEPDSFGGKSIAGAIGYFIGGTIFLGGAIVGLIALLVMVPLAASEAMAPERKVWWPEVRLERVIEKKLRVPLRQAGMLNDGTVVTTLPMNVARGQLKTGGGEEELRSVTAGAKSDVTTIEINNGEVVLEIDQKNRPVRLSFRGQEIPATALAEHLDLEITENSGEEVAGRLTFIGEGGMPSCRVSFRAGRTAQAPVKRQ
ncbi:MAG: hypothetical protein ACXW3E_03450 [Thermoanaerobaculia bacterium]